MKVVRTDSELQVPRTDAALRERGVNLVLLPEGTSEARLAQEVASADLLLMCYAKVTRNVIEGAARLRAIVKYGVGIDAIDLAAALDVYGQEPVIKAGHPLSALYAMDNVIVSPHLTFYTEEAMQRLEDETLRRCVEALEGKPLTVRWHDPRLPRRRVACDSIRREGNANIVWEPNPRGVPSSARVTSCAAWQAVQGGLRAQRSLNLGCGSRVRHWTICGSQA